MAEPVANTQQNTPSDIDLDAQIKADEAARNEPIETKDEESVPEPKQEDLEDLEPTKEENQEVNENAEYEKRIARLAYKEREARNQARQLNEELARLKGTAPPLEKDAEIERQVEQRATQLAAQKVFNDKANAVHAAGVKAFPDFESGLSALRDAGLPLSSQVIEAAIEVGEPHVVLHFLGKNLDEAERIMALPPHQMGVALAKIANKVSQIPAPKPQSKAPAPIKPLAGKAKAELTDETMPIDEYMKREDERARNRYRR